MAVACRQHHCLLGSGSLQRFRKESFQLSSSPFYPGFRKQRSSCYLNVKASSGSLPPDNTNSDKVKSSSSVFQRRREQLQADWDELSTPVPEPPNYLLIASGFYLIYLTRQAILEELVQWVAVLVAMVLTAINFIKKLGTVLLVKTLQVARAPVAFVLTWAAWSGIFAKNLYSMIINSTSIWPTAKGLLLVTLALSIGEATNPTAVSAQPWSFLMGSVFGVAVVWEVINPTIYVLLLLLLTCYSLLVQRKDAVSATLPATAMLVAIGEPPLKIVALVLYLATAVYTHWKSFKAKSELPEDKAKIVQPLVMIVAAVFVGLTAGSRFLTAWQVLWLAKG